METIAHHREEAKRYRDLAAASPGSETAKQWLRFAADHDRVADLLEAGDDSQSPVQHVLTQQHPMQQQESKQKPEDKE
jgi:hypothetical protein